MCGAGANSPARLGMIPSLWDDVAHGDDECVRFHFSLLSHTRNPRQGQPVN